MKLQINKKVKIGLISILIILIGTTSFLVYQQVNIPKYEEQITPIYTYSNKGSVNYTVFLKPNNLYKGNSLEEGNLYISEFVDYINTDFKYEFIGDRASDIKGKYEVLAKVQGFTGEDEKLKVIWQKDYIIVENKPFSIKDTSKVIIEEVKINLEPYNEFVTEIKELSKINSQTMLTLTMNISVEGMTDKGAINETISPNLMIPLDVAMFEIGGNYTIDKPGAIEETTQVQLPINKKQIMIYGITIAILTLVLIGVILFIKIAPKKDPHEVLLKKIFKKHGDRLVALNSDLLINDTSIMFVKSIDDLVRIADEIGKPILYKYSQNHNEINKFYITHEEQIYLLDLYNMLLKDEGDTTNIINDLEDHKEIKVES